ncbi:transmembrane protein 11 (predicted) [Rattus norvegicus]|uniref:Transmembrane protein 11 (Predicted) n=1 Tax=Rattus norvegicus TaxID=10116 RepID=A6HF63_RAT|nr:transmembrane protein 11 (predicted) [Rattus norvegicus]
MGSPGSLTLAASTRWSMMPINCPACLCTRSPPPHQWCWFGRTTCTERDCTTQ